MPQPERRSLRALSLAPGTADRFLSDETHRVALDRLPSGSCLDADVGALRGRSVLISTRAQLPTVLAMLDLDGIASRILLCPPDLPRQYLASIMAEAAVDAVVTDGTGPDTADRLTVRCHPSLSPAPPRATEDTDTEWVLFTSGTTGRPKMVRHTLPSLTGHLTSGPTSSAPISPGTPTGIIWSTFYDVRRYGGLSMLVRALLANASMVLSGTGETLGAFLTRAGACGVTHISGTPSHWRRAMMSPAAGALAPRNVRMSGEVADQAILDRLRAMYPTAQVTHAFASTEAGVAFEVTDGLAGFPASMFDGHSVKAEMRVEDGTLRIRSHRTASGYLGPQAGTVPDLAEPGGFVDTGDMVERRGDRYHFIGRREGVINVGGEKVYPEEVEAVINRHPAIRMSLVWPRPSPVTGAVVAADLVLEAGQPTPFATVRAELLDLCRQSLPAYKVPVSMREVPSLAIADSGKLVRRHA